jgi:hypothetical protein
MARDLFAIFPDLPWPRVGHPPPRDWGKLPPPAPSSRSNLAARRRLGVGSATTAANALRRIYAVALYERRRLKETDPGRRALDRIIELARAAI